MKYLIFVLAALLITGCNNKGTIKSQSIPDRDALSFSKTDDQNSKKTITRAQLETRIKTLRYFLQMQKGLPPETNSGKLTKINDQYRSSLKKTIQSVNSAISEIEVAKNAAPDKTLLDNCQRYYGLTGGALKDIEETEDVLKYQKSGTELSTLSQIRISIVRSFLDQLEHGISKDLDGSYIAAGMGEKCPIQARTKVKSDLNDFLEIFSKYWTARFGLDPILSEQNLKNVKGLLDKHESRQSLKKGAYFVGMTVLTMAFWELAVVRGAAIVGQVATLGSASVAVIRGVMVVGASAGMALMDRKLFPEDYDIPRPQTISEWNELLSQLEDFLGLSLKSAPSYAPYVYEADRARLMYLIEFLERRGNDLESAEKNFGSLEKALLYHENLRRDLP